MPDGSMAPVSLTTAEADATPRQDRPNVLAFVEDNASEVVVREGLPDLLHSLEVRRGNVRTAVTALQKMPSPRVLIVDVSNEEQPLRALADLSDVVEPDVCVLVIGELKDMEFYRAVTRNMGAMEYLAKPLSRDVVGRHFGPIIRGQAPASEAVTAGRLVTVTGVRGGVGASTVAAGLAWHSGATMRRHTVLLDADLHQGTAALLLDVEPDPGLCNALESPERIDTLLAERTALPAAERLHVLASQSNLAHDLVCAPGAATTLLDTLRRRFNAIVADVPFAPAPLQRELLQSAQQHVLVMMPTLACVRDTIRLLELTGSTSRAQRAVVLLNRAGMPGGLTRRQVEDALNMKVDVAIPDLPRQVNGATLMGEPAAGRGGFRAGILELARETGLFRMNEPDAAPPRRSLFGIFSR
jgi:pilus assembly protein CpaE